MDFEKYQNLHTIIMLKDVIRKWWQAELSFADKHGVVHEWQRGDIIPPPNDFCRLSLLSQGGLPALHPVGAGAAREVQGQPRSLRRALLHDCHLSFTIVGAPLYIDNEYEGMLFVEGFARQPLSAARGRGAQGARSAS